MAVRAGSFGSDECGLEERMLSLEVAAVTSRPVVKALGPAPEKIMTRVEGSWERWSNIALSSSHILAEGYLLAAGHYGYGSSGLRFDESVHFFGAIDLDMGDER